MGALEERTIVGDVGFIERQGVVGQHHIAIDGVGGGRHPGAIAPEQFFLLCGGAIGLLLVGTAFDAKPTIGVAGQPLRFVVAILDVDALVILFDPGVEVLDIESHRFAQPRDLCL